MTAELQPLVDLASNENIAIRTLSTMLYCCVAAIIALFGFLVLQTKNHREYIDKLTTKFDSSLKEAWGHVSKVSEALKKFTEDVAYALGRADAANGDRPDQGRRRRNTD